MAASEYWGTFCLHSEIIVKFDHKKLFLQDSGKMSGRGGSLLISAM
jgi:hypothetical protein